MAEVATRKLFENEKLIVWELHLEPGDNVGVHTHHNDYFVHVLEGSTITATDNQGASLGEFPFETGDSSWVSIDGSDAVLGDQRFPATHDAKNTGGSTYREILVEVK